MEKVVRPEDERAIILALPFDRRLPDAASILHQHYDLLVQRNPSVKNWMVRAPMVAHLRPANLRDFLVRAKLPPVDRRQGASRGLQPGFKKCGKARCLCCIYSTNSRTHTSTLTGQTWPIKQSITLPAEVHRAQGGGEEPLGHRGRGALQPSRARVGPLQLPPL